MHMKLLPVLIALPLATALATPASAASKPHHRAPAEQAAPVASDSGRAPEAKPATDRAAAGAQKPDGQNPALDFDFFGGQTGGAAAAGGAGAGEGGSSSEAEALELSRQSHTRRWMLRTHQVLGITTWASMLATVIVGQLNYNRLYGDPGPDPNKWQTPHRALVISTSALFAATATFAILAPTPHKKPLRFDTGLVHRIAVIGATLGMVTEGVLGWITTHQADAGNPHNLRGMALTHQIVGYTTLGFLTVAGTVWLF
jgi:hypothetical protein